MARPLDRRVHALLPHFLRCKACKTWALDGFACGSLCSRVGGIFPGFRNATAFACHQSLGVLLLIFFGQKCLMSSAWMSCRPFALPFFSALTPASNSAALEIVLQTLGRRGIVVDRDVHWVVCLWATSFAVVL